MHAPPKIFVVNKKPMGFYIPPDPRKAEISGRIQEGGGLINLSWNADLITLVCPTYRGKAPEGATLYSYNYVLDSIRDNKLKALEDYKVCPTTPAAAKHTSSSSPAASPSSAAKQGRMSYSKEEDEAIKKYVRTHDHPDTGNLLWKNLEQANILPGRTWQSLKDRYLHRIKPAEAARAKSPALTLLRSAPGTPTKSASVAPARASTSALRHASTPHDERSKKRLFEDAEDEDEDEEEPRVENQQQEAVEKEQTASKTSSSKAAVQVDGGDKEEEEEEGEEEEDEEEEDEAEDKEEQVQKPTTSKSQSRPGTPHSTPPAPKPAAKTSPHNQHKATPRTASTPAISSSSSSSSSSSQDAKRRRTRQPDDHDDNVHDRSIQRRADDGIDRWLPGGADYDASRLKETRSIFLSLQQQTGLPLPVVHHALFVMSGQPALAYCYLKHQYVWQEPWTSAEDQALRSGNKRAEAALLVSRVPSELQARRVYLGLSRS